MTDTTFEQRLLAIRGGSELEALVAIREQLADQFMVAPVTVASQYSSQLLKVLEREAEVRGGAVDPDRPKSVVDEMRRKREERANGVPVPTARKATRRRN